MRCVYFVFLLESFWPGICVSAWYTSILEVLHFLQETWGQRTQAVPPPPFNCRILCKQSYEAVEGSKTRNTDYVFWTTLFSVALVKWHLIQLVIMHAMQFYYCWFQNVSITDRINSLTYYNIFKRICKQYSPPLHLPIGNTRERIKPDIPSVYFLRLRNSLG